MDIENGVNEISHVEGLMVFNDIEYRISKGSRKGDGRYILKNVFGAFRPQKLTLILGSSGAGKTTLLKILAGRKKIGVKGTYTVYPKTVFVAQDTALIDNLTAKETLIFAVSLKLPNAKPHIKKSAIETIAKQLGIQDVLNTRAGKLSGGEKKRLSIACELLTDPPVILLDEPTSGLDSVSSLSVLKTLLNVARSGRTVACVVHQPSSKLFTSADDVIVLADGRTLYTGPITNTSEALSNAGFDCPKYYNMADYLLEIASNEHKGDLAMLQSETKNYIHEITANSRPDFANIDDKKRETEALIITHSVDSNSSKYAASLSQQLSAIIWRCCICSIRDVYLTYFRISCHIFVGILLGLVYAGAGENAGRVVSNTACVFFFLMFIYFGNSLSAVQTFPAEATVVIQEHLNRWYNLFAYFVSKILIDLPAQIICATVFLIPAWYLTSQPMEYERLSSAWMVCFLVSMLAQTFGVLIGTACGIQLGLFILTAINIPMLMFSEFFIPYKEVPVFFRPFADISYFRHSFNALLRTVYGFDRGRLPCHQTVCMFNKPDKYLEYLGISTDFSEDVFTLILWIVLLQITFMLVLMLKIRVACR